MSLSRKFPGNAMDADDLDCNNNNIHDSKYPRKIGADDDDDESFDSSPNCRERLMTTFEETASECGEEEEEDTVDGSDDVSSEQHNIAREDIKLMNVVRAIVIMLLLAFAFISMEVVYVVMIVQAQNSFRQDYSDLSARLLLSIHEDLDNKLMIAKSVADQMSLVTTSGSSTTAADAKWPFVTVENFQQRMAAPLQLSGASSISVAPLLLNEFRSEWESYATEQSVRLYNSQVPAPVVDQAQGGVSFFPTGRTVDQGIYRFEASSQAITEPLSSDILFPVWQMAPYFNGSSSEHVVGGTLFNLMSNPIRESGVDKMVLSNGASLSNFLYLDSNGTDYANYSDPRSVLFYPIHTATSDPTIGAAGVVGSVGLEFKWLEVFHDSIRNFEESLDVVIENSCGGQFTFHCDREETTFLGQGDLHERVPDAASYKPISTQPQAFEEIFSQHNKKYLETSSKQMLLQDPTTLCSFTFTVYATNNLWDEYFDQGPRLVSFVILVGLLVPVCFFFAYDSIVGQQQTKVVQAANRSDAIVRSLFPQAVRDKLYEQAIQKEEQKKEEMKSQKTIYEGSKKKLQRFVSSDSLDSFATDGKASHNIPTSDFTVEPIADLFPQTTVLFADISGFTAWSSERDPSQVFTLLETLYGMMDKVAKKLKVFKVETVGDCYVCCAGLPEPQPDHATIMARFARTCLLRVNSLTKKLESVLGPGTSELSFRIGLHSGPVTAGVLRGQKARFQLFGDTMNMAARMESTGEKNKIHISEDTAKLLIETGKQSWVSPREDLVEVKGKGLCKTYWLALSNVRTESTTHSDDESSKSSMNESGLERPMVTSRLNRIWAGTDLETVIGQTAIDSKLDRLVNWNTEVLYGFLKKIAAAAQVRGTDKAHPSPNVETLRRDAGGMVRDETQMIIALPEYDEDVFHKSADLAVELPNEIRKQLRDYVAAVATGYKTNSFHNFEHASHVILSATKLLKRIVQPDDMTGESGDLHKYTFGIASDPIAQFAIVFSALVHDLGHEGVPNFRLAVENPEIAEKYQNKSIAEQHSIDVAWNLLMRPHFAKLRSCIYKTKAEFHRFRALLVNSVIATDIFDKELKELRNKRWDAAFDKKEAALSKEDEDRKATIVIEHIIQASDVAHTMQHWHIYLKWNERLFTEMYMAYLQGRADKDPSEGWFAGEKWFYDNYVIPLAGKLKECQVFGVSSDEYLIYAEQNRNEWERKGEASVALMKENALHLARKMNLQLDSLIDHGATGKETS